MYFWSLVAVGAIGAWSVFLVGMTCLVGKAREHRKRCDALSNEIQANPVSVTQELPSDLTQCFLQLNDKQKQNNFLMMLASKGLDPFDEEQIQGTIFEDSPVAIDYRLRQILQHARSSQFQKHQQQQKEPQISGLLTTTTTTTTTNVPNRSVQSTHSKKTVSNPPPTPSLLSDLNSNKPIEIPFSSKSSKHSLSVKKSKSRSSGNNPITIDDSRPHREKKVKHRSRRSLEENEQEGYEDEEEQEQQQEDNFVNSVEIHNHEQIYNPEQDEQIYHSFDDVDNNYSRESKYPQNSTLSGKSRRSRRDSIPVQQASQYSDDYEQSTLNFPEPRHTASFENDTFFANVPVDSRTSKTRNKSTKKN